MFTINSYGIYLTIYQRTAYIGIWYLPMQADNLIRRSTVNYICVLREFPKPVHRSEAYSAGEGALAPILPGGPEDVGKIGVIAGVYLVL